MAGGVCRSCIGNPARPGEVDRCEVRVHFEWAVGHHTVMITRRRLLATGGVLLGGLAVGVSIPEGIRLTQVLKHVPPLAGRTGWIHIEPDESVTVFSSLAEMGQGVWTALAQIVGEELEADTSRVRVAMAPGWRAYSVPVGFATGGSSSVPRLLTSMRTVAAAARHMLIETAADQWKVPVAECFAENGVVRHRGSGRSSTFGVLAPDAAGRTPPANPSLKPRQQWRVMGQPLARLENPAKVNGTAQFGMDLRLPGMVVAAVSQSPFNGARLKSVDTKAALAVAGVTRVVQFDDMVAVVGKNYWSASRGLEKAAVKWGAPAEPVDSLQLSERLRQAVEGSSQSAASGRRVSVTYAAPFVTHAAIEPMNATAWVRRLGVEVWAASQTQGAMQTDIAAALDVWDHLVTVNTPLIGGGFGRRLETDNGVTAARLSKEIGGPVQAVWPRTEDFVQSRFRPMSAAHFEGSLSESGGLERVVCRVAAISKHSRTGGLEPFPYRIPQQETTFTPVSSPVRTGSWRSVDGSQNVFFRESFIDECATAAGADPLQFRRSMLESNARALRVLDAVAELSSWADRQKSGRFLGVAFHDGYGSLSAQVVEVTRAGDGSVSIARIFIAVDCGTVINPDGLRAQLEGGALFGLSAALHEEATFQGSELQQKSLDSYRLLRISEAPPVEIRVLESPDAPIGGIGEVGVPPVAPALANALFAATGKRLRKLPLTSEDVRWARPTRLGAS